MNETEGKRLERMAPLAALLPPSAQLNGPSSESELSEPEYDCPKCKDARWLRYARPLGDPLFGKSYPCTCVGVGMPAAMNVPDELAGKTFADFDLKLNPKMGRALKLAKAVASGEAWCTLLLGDPGLGKTLLAVAALNESTHPHPGYFWEWGALTRSLKADLFTGERKASEEELLRPWQTGRFLLVIDDVGAEKVTEWTRATMYAIVNERRLNSLPTILTSNDDSAIDERVLDRMYKWTEACEGTSVRRR